MEIDNPTHKQTSVGNEYELTQSSSKLYPLAPFPPSPKSKLSIVPARQVQPGIDFFFGNHPKRDRGTLV